MNALEAIAGKDPSGRGVCCTYYRISETVGVKLYGLGYDSGRGEYEKSRLAHRVGLGPKVWGFCQDAKRNWWCAFYVQHVDILGDVVRASKSKYLCHQAVYDWYLTMSSMLAGEAKNIGKKHNIKVYISDLHDDNIGLINGRPVIIDFSHCVIGHHAPAID